MWYVVGVGPRCNNASAEGEGVKRELMGGESMLNIDYGNIYVLSLLAKIYAMARVDISLIYVNYLFSE